LLQSDHGRVVLADHLLHVRQVDGVQVRQRDVDAFVRCRVFLNNVSLGIYGEAVRSLAYRDAQVLTLLETAAEVMGPSAKAPALRLADNLGRD
jgi:hypothetical protein